MSFRDNWQTLTRTEKWSFYLLIALCLTSLFYFISFSIIQLASFDNGNINPIIFVLSIPLSLIVYFFIWRLHLSNLINKESLPASQGLKIGLIVSIFLLILFSQATVSHSYIASLKSITDWIIVSAVLIGIILFSWFLGFIFTKAPNFYRSLMLWIIILLCAYYSVKFVKSYIDYKSVINQGLGF
ncbi:MAG: hypothetical protein ACP5NS_00985 [Candidatus Pacearchaeota archaeon]